MYKSLLFFYFFIFFNINVKSQCSVNIQASDTVICFGSQVTLLGLGSSTYNWSDGVFNGITFTPSHTTTFQLTAIDSIGCISYDSITITVNPLPIINVSSPNSIICQGLSTVLNAIGGVSYSWLPGSLSGSSITVIPSLSTTYTVTGIGSNGCSNTATELITVNPLPLVSTSSVSSSICFGSSMSINGTGALSYSWMPGSYTGTPIIVSPISTTTYTLTGTDINGCLNSATRTITVNPLPTISASATLSTICSGSSTTLLGSGGVSYNWMPGSLSGASLIVSPTSTTTYTLTGTDLNGCSNISTVTITVNPLPIINVSSPNSIICQGLSTVLNAIGGVSYSWLPGSLSGSSITVIPSLSTTYTVTGIGSNGCSNTATELITVNPLPLVSTSSVSSSICFGSSMSINGTGALSYSWMPGSYTGTPIIVSPISTTTYTLTGTDINGCLNSATRTITVNPLPTISASATLSTICSGSSTTLLGSGGVSYNWMPGSLSGASLIVSPTSTTTYTLTGTDLNGCSNISTVTITVNPLPIVNANSSSLIICPGDSVYLFGSGTSSVNYSWSNGVIDNVPYFPEGTLNYILTGLDSNGCFKMDSIFVNVYDSLYSGEISSQNLCYGFTPDTIMFSISPSGGGNLYAYQWQVSTDNISFVNIIGANSVYYVSDTLMQSKFYRVIVTSLAGCGYSITNSQIVNVYSPFSSGNIIGIDTICYNSSPNNIAFSINPFGGSGLYSYQWLESIDQITWLPIFGETNATYQPPNLYNTIFYRVLVTDAQGCGVDSTNIIGILVNPNPASVLIIGPDSVCRNQSDVYYTASSINVSSIGYGWNINDGYIYTGAWNYECFINFYNYPSIDTLELTQTYIQTGCSTIDKKIITITNNESPNKTSIIRKPGSDILICADTSIGIRYQWGYTVKATMNDVLIPGATLRYVLLPHTFDTTLYYYFVITYFDYGISSCETRSEYNRPELVLSVNSLDESASKFNFYPNPSNGWIQLSNFNSKDKIRIIDLNGREIKYSLSSDVLKLGENISNGIYFLQLIGDTNISNFKIVVAK